MGNRLVIPAFWRFAAFFILLQSAVMPTPVLAGVQIGGKAGSFRLEDTSGNVHSLEGYAGKIIVLEFWSFKCPVSLAYDERLASLQQRYRDRGVIVLAVASNKNESPAEIRSNVQNLGLTVPVLLDNQGWVAEKYEATHTPGIFILDRAGILRYRGAFDNNRLEGDRERIPYAEEALKAILDGRPVPRPETRVFGCSIKR